MAFGVPGVVRVDVGPRESFEAPVIRFSPSGVYLRAGRPMPLGAQVRITVSDLYGLMFTAITRVVASSPSTLGLALADSTPEPVLRAFAEWTVGQLRGAPLTPSSNPVGGEPSWGGPAPSGARPSAPPPGYALSAPPSAPPQYSSVPPSRSATIPRDSLPPLPEVSPPPPAPSASTKAEPRTVSQAFDAQFTTDALAPGDPRKPAEDDKPGLSLIEDLEL